MKTFLTALFTFLVSITVLAILSLLFAFPVKWLANYVLSPALLITLFGGALNIWKAWALSVLCGLLFTHKGK